MYHLNGEILHPFPGFVAVPGHFSSAEMVPPRFVAVFRTFFFTWSFPPHFGGEMRMFCCWERFPPRFVAFSGTFFLLGGIFSRFYPQNKDVSPPPPHFLPELWRSSGHSSSAVNVSPGKYLFPGTFSLWSRTGAREVAR